MKNITVAFKVEKIQSTNVAYKYTRQKSTTRVFKTRPIKRFQEAIQWQAKKHIPANILKELQQAKVFECTYQFNVTNDRVNKVDVTNLLKHTEDAIFTVLEINDVKVKKNTIIKLPTDDEDESIIFRLEWI